MNSRAVHVSQSGVGEPNKQIQTGFYCARLLSSWIYLLQCYRILITEDPTDKTFPVKRGTANMQLDSDFLTQTRWHVAPPATCTGHQLL